MENSTGWEFLNSWTPFYPRINELVRGKRGITPDTALSLERLFGMERNFGSIFSLPVTFTTPLIPPRPRKSARSSACRFSPQPESLREKRTQVPISSFNKKGGHLPTKWVNFGSFWSFCNRKEAGSYP